MGEYKAHILLGIFCGCRWKVVGFVPSYGASGINFVGLFEEKGGVIELLEPVL